MPPCSSECEQSIVPLEVATVEPVVPKIEIPKHILEDSRFVPIGDLPTGYVPYKDIGLTEIYMRPFEVGDLPMIHRGANTKSGVAHIIRAMTLCSSTDMGELTDGDFEFCMAWMRKQSYPDGPTFVRWNCNNPVQAYKINDQQPDEDVPEDQMELNGLHYRPCGRENNELVFQGQMRIVTVDDDMPPLPAFMDYPRIKTYPQLEDIKRDRPEDYEIAKHARWLRKGETLDEKIVFMDELTMEQYLTVLKLSKEYKHGIYEILPLRCRGCDYRTTYRSDVNYTKFFADNSDLNVLDIQYSLLTKLHLQPSESMPTKRFFYHHSCFMKDMQEQEEKARVAAAAKGKKVRVI